MPFYPSNISRKILIFCYFLFSKKDFYISLGTMFHNLSRASLESSHFSFLLSFMQFNSRWKHFGVQFNQKMNANWNILVSLFFRILMFYGSQLVKFVDSFVVEFIGWFDYVIAQPQIFPVRYFLFFPSNPLFPHYYATVGYSCQSIGSGSIPVHYIDRHVYTYYTCQFYKAKKKKQVCLRRNLKKANAKCVCLFVFFFW